MEAGEKDALMKKAYCTLILCLGDRVLREVTKETTAAGIWTKLTSLYMTTSLANRLYLKKKLYTYNMSPGTKLGDHIHEFNKLILDLANIDIENEDEDQTLMLLTLLPSSYENFMETLLYGRESLIMKDVLATLNSMKLKKRTEGIKEETGDGLYVRGRSDYSGKAHSSGSLRFKSRGGTGKLKRFICHSEGHLKRDCPMKKVKWVHQKRYVPGLKRSLISLGTLEKEGYTIKMQVGRIKGAQGNHEAGVFQVSNDDAAVAQRWLEDKQLEKKTNTDFLVKEQEKGHLGIKVGANITVTGVPGQEGGEGNVTEKKKVEESMEADLGLQIEDPSVSLGYKGFILITKGRLKKAMTKTMTKSITEEYVTKAQDDCYSGITKTMINGKTAYELKGKFLDDLQNNAFSGTNGEDVDPF
ncbi:hypothetical protein Tco_0199768 [Tanacetum coccineum]